MKGFFISIIFIDLFIFSFYGTGFRVNMQNFEELVPKNKVLFDVVKSDSDIFRILPYGVASGNLPNWSLLNSNVIFEIDSVGAYSPLACKKYYDKLKPFETVDDSLAVLPPDKLAFQKNAELVKNLNVKYVISSEKINENILKERGFDKGVWLYEVRGFRERVFFVDSVKDKYHVISGKVKILSYKSGYMEVSVNMAKNGYLVFSEYNYPGWEATIDGENVSLETFDDILMAVFVPKGEHRVVFRYKPELI